MHLSHSQGDIMQETNFLTLRSRTQIRSAAGDAAAGTGFMGCAGAAGARAAPVKAISL
jgi:hypothetical protein